MARVVEWKNDVSWVRDSISVDASWSPKTKVVEWQGVLNSTGETVFRRGPFAGGTNNIGEFLAIVHALSVLQKFGKTMVVYSDSRTAIAWVRQRKANTCLQPTEENKELMELVSRAEAWLARNKRISPVIKWDTTAWGEIPADFGRK